MESTTSYVPYNENLIFMTKKKDNKLYKVFSVNKNDKEFYL